MIEIRIVCTHDALRFAEQVVRLLEAEQHVVRLVFGRQSLVALEAARSANEAVLLIWSNDAPAQHYMLEWARAVPPVRLVEVACAPGWPRFERRAPVIDFTGWRPTDRGARAWHALSERLHAIAHVLTPGRPALHRRAPMTVGLAGMAAAAVGSVMIMQGAPRVGDAQPLPDLPPPPQSEQVSFQEVAVAAGGAVDLIEPPSVDNMLDIPSARTPRLRMPILDISENPRAELPELRRPTLRERITALNPLRVLGDSAENGGES